MKSFTMLIWCGGKILSEKIYARMKKKKIPFNSLTDRQTSVIFLFSFRADKYAKNIEQMRFSSNYLSLSSTNIHLYPFSI